MADLTKFVERNPLLRDEVREFVNTPNGDIVSWNDTGRTNFYSQGKKHFTTIGSEIYIGRKVISKRSDHYVRSSLINALLTVEVCPEIEPFMPQFMVGIRQNGEYTSILMEDYSKAKEEIVPEARMVRIESFPQSFVQLMKDKDDLKYYFGITNNGLKLMDFNLFDWIECYDNLRFERMTSEDLDILKDHTIDI